MCYNGVVRPSFTSEKRKMDGWKEVTSKKRGGRNRGGKNHQKKNYSGSGKGTDENNRKVLNAEHHIYDYFQQQQQQQQNLCCGAMIIGPTDYLNKLAAEANKIFRKLHSADDSIKYQKRVQDIGESLEKEWGKKKHPFKKFWKYMKETDKELERLHSLETIYVISVPLNISPQEIVIAKDKTDDSPKSIFIPEDDIRWMKETQEAYLKDTGIKYQENLKPNKRLTEIYFVLEKILNIPYDWSYLVGISTQWIDASYAGYLNEGDCLTDFAGGSAGKPHEETAIKEVREESRIDLTKMIKEQTQKRLKEQYSLNFDTIYETDISKVWILIMDDKIDVSEMIVPMETQDTEKGVSGNNDHNLSNDFGTDNYISDNAVIEGEMEKISI